ncbi:hypothetical protein ACFLZ2_05175 [Candidatus Margulisiibacteriota bacterium]
MNTSKIFLGLFICLFFSQLVYCAGDIVSRVYLNDEVLADAQEIVLFAKVRPVQVSPLGLVVKGRSFDLFGKMVFDGDQKILDEKINKKERFDVTYKTIDGDSEESLTFSGCLMDGKYGEGGLVVYRFLATDIR